MNLRKLLTDVGASAGRTGLEVLRGIIVVPLITKLIGTDAYGLWATLLGVVSIATAVGDLGTGQALIRYTPGESREGRTFVDILGIVAVTGTATAVLFLTVDTTIGILPPGADRSLIHASAALILVQSTGTIVRNYPRARDEVKVFEMLNVAQTVLELVAIGIVLFVFRDLVAGIWTLVGVALVVDGATLLRYRPDDVSLPQLDDIRQYVTFSVPMLVQSLSARVVRNIDKVLLLQLISPTAVAVYAVSAAIARFLENFMETLNPGLYPKVVRAWETGERRQLAELYTFILRWFVILGLPAVAGLGLLARPILLTVSTSVVAERGLLLLPALAFAFLLSGFNSPLVFIVQAAERNEQLMIGYVAAAGLNLVLNLALIPRFGTVAAAVATLLSYGSITVYLLYWTRSRVRFALPFAVVPRALVSTAVMVLVLRRLVPSFGFPMELVLSPLIGALVYFAVMFAVGGVRRQELENVYGVVVTE